MIALACDHGGFDMKQIVIEYLEEKSYQAVIPAREEIPDEMQVMIEDVILYLKSVLETH